MKAGAARRDITPPVGMTIAPPERKSIGVHGPLSASALFLDDQVGGAVAIFCFDLVGCSFETAEQVHQAVKNATGIEHVLLNFSHTHSGRGLDPRSDGSKTDDETAWNDSVHDAILDIVAEAKAAAVPVTLLAGRATAQVGFNRRIMYEDGQVGMGVNKEGPVVPWVNVLAVKRQDTGQFVSVLLEHAAHPVIVPDTSSLTSADFPGSAVARINEELGDGAVVMFAQGCGANINAYPLRTTHENSDAAGRELGEAALQALASATPLAGNTLIFRETSVALPCQPYPSMEVWQQTVDNLASDWKRGTESGRPVDWITEEVYNATIEMLDKVRGFIESGQAPPARRIDVSALMLGSDWCLVALGGETFCQYELWADEAAPFAHNMTLGYTNGIGGYVAGDDALAMGATGGYEAGGYPCWWASGIIGPSYSPLEVGTQERIQQAIASLWADR